MEWVIDRSVIAWSLVTLSLFNCVGFSDVGFPVVGFSDDGLSNDGGKETGCSWMMYSLLLNLPLSSVVWWRSMYPARSNSLTAERIASLKNAADFFKICGVRRDAETGGVLPTSPVFCAVVHLFAPPRFPLPLKNIDFTGVFHVFLWQRPFMGRPLSVHITGICVFVQRTFCWKTQLTIPWRRAKVIPQWKNGIGSFWENDASLPKEQHSQAAGNPDEDQKWMWLWRSPAAPGTEGARRKTAESLR